MQRAMQRHCAVFRTARCSTMVRASSTTSWLRDDLAMADRSMIFNTDLAEALELDNMLAQANVSL